MFSNNIIKQINFNNDLTFIFNTVKYKSHVLTCSKIIYIFDFCFLKHVTWCYCVHNVSKQLLQHVTQKRVHRSISISNRCLKLQNLQKKNKILLNWSFGSKPEICMKTCPISPIKWTIKWSCAKMLMSNIALYYSWIINACLTSSAHIWCHFIKFITLVAHINSLKHFQLNFHAQCKSLWSLLLRCSFPLSLHDAGRVTSSLPLQNV